MALGLNSLGFPRNFTSLGLEQLQHIDELGDPYQQQIEANAKFVMQRLAATGYGNNWTLAYQSRVGPVEWLRPYTDDTIRQLCQEGVRLDPRGLACFAHKPCYDSIGRDLNVDGEQTFVVDVALKERTVSVTKLLRVVDFGVDGCTLTTDHLLRVDLTLEESSETQESTMLLAMRSLPASGAKPLFT